MIPWYHRMAEIPNVKYAGRSDIDRQQLPGYSSTPNAHPYQEYFEMSKYELWWPESESSSSRSPAIQWFSKITDQSYPRRILRNLYEALELPGTATDYHSILAQGGELLMAKARSTPDLLQEVENLCWIDVDLVTVQREALIQGTYQSDPERPFLYAPAFLRLVSLYEREGFLNEALEIAQQGISYGQCQHLLAELEQRVNRIKDEDAKPQTI